MKRIFSPLLLAAALFFAACDTTTGCDPNPEPCIDESKVCATCACIEIYAPVCGCDGVTYDNDCFADAAGVTSYSSGACAGGN